MDNIHTPIIVGKAAIESLTVGMYDNALCVYREYIQNSADAIDKAIDHGLVSKKEARIHIEIQPNDKTIIFEDNGTGIPQHKFVSSLQNVAQSEKISGKDKGFRGIGRLGGLGYCEELIFETSVKGENVKSIMIWDAKKMKKMVSDYATKEGAAEVVRSVTTFKMEKEAVDKHYFNVRMNGVTNADLLNVTEVTEYLSMVAPVSYKGSFKFRNQIYDYLKELNVVIDEYKLYVNEEEIFKAHTTEIYKKKSANSDEREKIKDVIDIKLFHLYNEHKELLFAGWHSITDKVNQLDPTNIARGLRLRKGNIQIGDENRLEALYGRNSEARFNFHAIGEVFTFHPQLIPNGRRDDFEENDVYLAFQKGLRPICKGIRDLSYETSKITSAKKKIEDFIEAATAFEQKEAETNFINDLEKEIQLRELKKQYDEVEKSEKLLEKMLQDAYSKGETSGSAIIINSIIADTLIEIKKAIEGINDRLAIRPPTIFTPPVVKPTAPIVPPVVKPTAPIVPPVVKPTAPIVPPVVKPTAPIIPPVVKPTAPIVPPTVKPKVPSTTPKPKFRADKLKLPEEQKTLMSQVYEIIRTTLLDEAKTEMIIRKIEETFK